MLIHGHDRIGKVSREYTCWRRMKSRCLDPSNAQYRDYGGRGITVCKLWKESFQAFFNDMGPCPRGMMIDRIDNGGNYEPRNCRWADQITQQNNRRSNRRLVFNGDENTLAEWGRITGLAISTIRNRLKAGWTVGQSLTTKPDKRNRKGGPPASRREREGKV